MLLLYPFADLLAIFDAQLLQNGGVDSACSGELLKKLLEHSQNREAHRAEIVGKVPVDSVIPFVLPTCKITPSRMSNSLTIRQTRSKRSSPSIRLFLSTRQELEQWEQQLSRSPVEVQKSLSDFSVIRRIGKGGYGQVYEVRDRFSGEPLAMKVMPKPEAPHAHDIRSAADERLIMAACTDHPFNMRLRHAFESVGQLYLFMQLCSRGDLYHATDGQRVDEHVARLIASELLLALEHLHEQGVIYRDIKQENVLVCDDGHVMLTDFGLSRKMEGVKLTNTWVGTPIYMAPEVVDEKFYDAKVDLWSFGVLIYEMLTGGTPFGSRKTKHVCGKIRTLEPYYPSSMSEDAKALIQALLQKKACDRLGAGPRKWEEVKQHPWFASIDWDEIELRGEETSPFGRQEPEKPEGKKFDSYSQQEQQELKHLARDMTDDLEYVKHARGWESRERSKGGVTHPLAKRQRREWAIGGYNFSEGPGECWLQESEQREPLRVSSLYCEKISEVSLEDSSDGGSVRKKKKWWQFWKGRGRHRYITS